MTVWPNGKRTPPKFSSLWKEYDGVADYSHWGLDMYGHYYNYAIDDGEIINVAFNTFGGGGWEIYLKLDNGDIILYYHNRKDVRVRVGQRVSSGTILGVQSNSGKTFGVHLHLEVWIDGYRARRVNPLPYIKALVGLSAAGDSGSKIPAPKRKKKTMSTLYHKDGSKPALYALAGESAGTPANWQPTTDYGLAVQWARIHGNAIPLSAGTWDNYQADFLAPVNTAGGSAATADVTVSLDPDVLVNLIALNAAIVAQTTALGAKLDALPAEIDRYNDGRKNAS